MIAQASWCPPILSYTSLFHSGSFASLPEKEKPEEMVPTSELGNTQEHTQQEPFRPYRDLPTISSPAV